MDCETCGRHRPSEQIVALRSSAGAVVMVCGRCRRLVERRGEHQPAGRLAASMPGAAALGAPH